MIIKPYSAIAADVLAASDFPALAHYFPCDEATGDTYITDAASGATVWGGSAGDAAFLTNSGSHLTLPEGFTVIRSGAWTSPATKKVVVISTGLPSTTSGFLRFGGITAAANSGFAVNSAATTGSTPLVANGTVKITGTDGLDGSASGDQWQTRALIIDFGTDGTGGTYGITQYDYDGTTYTARAAVSLATCSGITTIEQVVHFGVNSNPANIQVWHFDAVPADVKAAMLWTHANSQAGVKAPYPAWRCRS